METFIQTHWGILLLEFTLPPLPYNLELQLILAGSIALIELILFGLCLWNLKNRVRGNYLLALLMLTILIAFITGQAFNEYYYADYLRDEYATKVDASLLYKAKAFFTISSLIGLVLSAITVFLRMWKDRKVTTEGHAK